VPTRMSTRTESLPARVCPYRHHENLPLANCATEMTASRTAAVRTRLSRAYVAMLIARQSASHPVLELYRRNGEKIQFKRLPPRRSSFDEPSPVDEPSRVKHPSSDKDLSSVKNLAAIARYDRGPISHISKLEKRVDDTINETRQFQRPTRLTLDIGPPYPFFAHI